MPSFAHVPACHSRVPRHIRPVREALVTSVTKVGSESEAEGEEEEPPSFFPLLPPVRWKISQLSTVPRASFPSSAAFLTAGTFSRSQSIL